MPNSPSELPYCSLLSYASHPGTDEQKKSAAVTKDLKRNRQYPSGGICEFVAKRILKHPAAFQGFFGAEVIAVPVPSSTRKQPGSLNVPLELARTLKLAGLVGEIEDIVTRVRSLPKSATSDSKARSTAADHFDSVIVAKPLLPASATLLLVDDVVTRGATLMGVAWRLQQAFPGAKILAFAAMRAITDAKDFKAILDPVSGKITLAGRYTKRRP